MATESTKGRLLVASPVLVDPNFDRRVVLMLEHTPDGALGLVLNDPMTVLAVDALPEPLSNAFGWDDLLHCGGPVEESAVIVLAELRDMPPAAGTRILGDVAVLDPNGDLATTIDATIRARAFAGYAGWSSGQLDQEIEEGAWINVEASPSDVFGQTPDDLWRTVLERAGGSYRLVARMPPDPTMN